MKIEFDPEADAAYLELIDGEVARTEQIESGIIGDFDENGRLLGLEILYISKRSSLEPAKKVS